jgi:hypothetical protein
MEKGKKYMICNNFFCFFWVKPGIDRKDNSSACENGREGFPEYCGNRKAWNRYMNSFNKFSQPDFRLRMTLKRIKKEIEEGDI